jgi:Domain of unknown function (DUF4157)
MAMMAMGVSPKETAPTGDRRPAMQQKLQIGRVDDPLEHEADRIADAVVSGRPVGAITGAAAAMPQRKCAHCEAEEEKTLRRKAVGSTSVSHHDASTAAATVASGGAGLSPRQRAYFEPRFGRDLSAVRLHMGGRAGEAAAQMNARAFTLGRDIAFAPGEFNSETSAGRHLLAHELAHVVQQELGPSPIIRRASYGSGALPNFSNSTTSIVPDEDRERVNAAMAIIDDLVSKPESFSECHDQFKTLCPGGTTRTLTSVWQNATIWRISTTDKNVYAKGEVAGTDIAYTQKGYDQGAEGLAGSLLHEAGHNCGIPGDATHWHAAKIANYCIGPGRNSISLGLGFDLGGEFPSLVLSYRRFLGDFASGRLKLTLGADLNVIGTSLGIADSLGSNSRTIPRNPAEFGSVMAGAQTRLVGWGGSRYGGFSLRFETGFGVGQFALRRAADEDPKSAIAPTWILQVGPRAEFLVKTDDAHVFPFAISAAFRHVQPINGEARALNAIVGSVEFPF